MYKNLENLLFFFQRQCGLNLQNLRLKWMERKKSEFSKVENETWKNYVLVDH